MGEYEQFSTGTLRLYRSVQTRLEQLQGKGEAAARAVVIPGSPEPRGNIIIFTGSFNPPTIAHLALLKAGRRYARQHGGMRIYAAMSKVTVDKENVERPTQLDRIMLLRQLLPRWVKQAGILVFNAGLYVEQADAVHQAFPAVRHILFLIGFDKIVQIFDAHYYQDRDAALEELFKRAELLVAPRGQAGKKELEELLQRPENQRFARYIHALPFSPNYRAISSTAVRQHARQNIEDEQAVPIEVRRFMLETRAYSSPIQRPDGSEIDVYSERVKRLKVLLRKLQTGIRHARGGT